jgi:hypothetical protein
MAAASPRSMGRQRGAAPPQPARAFGGSPKGVVTAASQALATASAFIPPQRRNARTCMPATRSTARARCKPQQTCACSLGRRTLALVATREEMETATPLSAETSKRTRLRIEGLRGGRTRRRQRPQRRESSYHLMGGFGIGSITILFIIILVVIGGTDCVLPHFQATRYAGLGSGRGSAAARQWRLAPQYQLGGYATRGGYTSRTSKNMRLAAGMTGTPMRSRRRSRLGASRGGRLTTAGRTWRPPEAAWTCTVPPP